MVQMNGVAGGGTGITVDGTEANASPEARSMSQYGAQNQISVMSIDAVQEVQIIKGVLPAEYGGVVGGQVNMISRLGTNNFRGSAFFMRKTRYSTPARSSRRRPSRSTTSAEYRRHARRAGRQEQDFLFEHLRGLPRIRPECGFLNGTVPYPQLRVLSRRRPCRFLA